MVSMKYLSAAALAATLTLSGAGLAMPAHAASPAKAQGGVSNNVETQRAGNATDMSAQRRYYRQRPYRPYRYVRPWRQPYPYAYGYYRPRPYYYRPRPYYYGPPVFSFGFGPRYW
jgi:hypothetical protein